MTQDTRKDRRVKIVSLNVRYKSATVDEFIENHAHDVSRGGIYIKTANPFPAGTLLKFEIRLASDQAVIAGVGRVVWKRDAAHGQGERPAGMGVKFIKIDPPSAAVIDKLVNTRSDAGKSFESEPEASDVPPPVLQPAAASKAPAPPAAAAASVPVRKATMMGIGIANQVAAAPASVSPPRPTPSTPPRPSPAASGPLFPKTNPEAEQPAKQEQTVMKQAAELLEEALREAGGSMEDVGTNPLFSGGVAPSPAKVATEPAAPPPAEDEETKARALVAGLAPAPAQEKKGPSEPPPRTTRDTPGAKVSDRPKVASRPPSKPPSRAPAPYASRASDAPPAKKGSGGTLLVVVSLAAAAAAAFVYKDKIFGGAPPEPQMPTTAASVASTHPAETASAPSTSAASASAEATPSASASAQSTPEASVPAAAASPPSPQASAAPPPAKPAAAPIAPAAAIAKPTPAVPAAAPASPPAAAPAPPSTPAVAATPAPAAPKPAAPKPKPKAAEEDNPY